MTAIVPLPLLHDDDDGTQLVTTGVTNVSAEHASIDWETSTTEQELDGGDEPLASITRFSRSFDVDFFTLLRLRLSELGKSLYDS